MAERSEVDNPYRHSKKAQECEQNGDMRGAEEAYRAVVKAADALPLDEYKKHFQSKAAHEYAPAAGAEATFSEIERAYQELLCLPFLSRVQLAGFYARHHALPEAREVCEEALKLGVDDSASANKTYAKMHERAQELHNDLLDIIGPSNIETIFHENFQKLDVNHDGFVDEMELKRAQLDLSIDADGQRMIRYMLYHYLDIEVASADELLSMGQDVRGITKSDVKNYQKSANADWKRMKKKH